MVTLQTPTRVVKLELIDSNTGVDWSNDYIGNNKPSTFKSISLEDDLYEVVDYLCTDEEAAWWEKHIDNVKDALDCVNNLSSKEKALLDAVVENESYRFEVPIDDEPEVFRQVIAEIKNKIEKQLMHCYGLSTVN